MKKRMTKDGTVRNAALPNGVDRRDFLKASALVAGMGVWVATGTGVKAFGEQSANDKINGASIGVGGKGDSDSEHLAGHANLVAICDVDEKTLASKAARHPKAKKFNDFRRMFDEMGKEIDAVTISTPDHTHAIATMTAMKLGKHVYTQKPLTHDVWEARQLRLTAAEKKISSQMGNQGTHNNTLRKGVSTMRAGVLGKIKEVHVWTNRPIWPQAPGVMEALPEQPVPENMHWDEWIGTAPMRPYNHGYAPFNWRGWWDFGTGALGDMGCHTVNMPFMGLKLEYPTSLQGECGDLNPQTYPSWARVVYEFPARGELPPVTLTWYEGHKDGKQVLPSEDLIEHVMKHHNKKQSKKEKIINSGSLIVGEKAIMYSPDDYGGRWELLPAMGSDEEVAETKVPAAVPETHGDDDEGNKIEWLEAARGGSPSIGNFSYAGLLAETILLGNIAIKNAGKKLEWDGPGLTFKDNPEANKLLRREYRKPWSF